VRQGNRRRVRENGSSDQMGALAFSLLQCGIAEEMASGPLFDTLLSPVRRAYPVQSVSPRSDDERRFESRHCQGGSVRGRAEGHAGEWRAEQFSSLPDPILVPTDEPLHAAAPIASPEIRSQQGRWPFAL